MRVKPVRLFFFIAIMVFVGAENLKNRGNGQDNFCGLPGSLLGCIRFYFRSSSASIR
jgi:hypothetical protein